MNNLIGRRVAKIGGSFQHTGTVVAAFTTTLGQERIVLEFDEPIAGMLHIYRPDQVELVKVKKELWVNIYTDDGGFLRISDLYRTEEDAFKAIADYCKGEPCSGATVSVGLEE